MSKGNPRHVPAGAANHRGGQFDFANSAFCWVGIGGSVGSNRAASEDAAMTSAGVCGSRELRIRGAAMGKMLNSRDALIASDEQIGNDTKSAFVTLESTMSNDNKVEISGERAAALAASMDARFNEIVEQQMQQRMYKGLKREVKFWADNANSYEKAMVISDARAGDPMRHMGAGLGWCRDAYDTVGRSKRPDLYENVAAALGVDERDVDVTSFSGRGTEDEFSCIARTHTRRGADDDEVHSEAFATGSMTPDGAKNSVHYPKDIGEVPADWKAKKGYGANGMFTEALRNDDARADIEGEFDQYREYVTSHFPGSRSEDVINAVSKSNDLYRKCVVLSSRYAGHEADTIADHDTATPAPDLSSPSWQSQHPDAVGIPEKAGVSFDSFYDECGDTYVGSSYTIEESHEWLYCHSTTHVITKEGKDITKKVREVNTARDHIPDAIRDERSERKRDRDRIGGTERDTFIRNRVNDALASYDKKRKDAYVASTRAYDEEYAKWRTSNKKHEDEVREKQTCEHGGLQRTMIDYNVNRAMRLEFELTHKPPMPPALAQVDMRADAERRKLEKKAYNAAKSDYVPSPDVAKRIAESNSRHDANEIRLKKGLANANRIRGRLIKKYGIEKYLPRSMDDLPSEVKDLKGLDNIVA